MHSMHGYYFAVVMHSMHGYYFAVRRVRMNRRAPDDTAPFEGSLLFDLPLDSPGVANLSESLTINSLSQTSVAYNGADATATDWPPASGADTLTQNSTAPDINRAGIGATAADECVENNSTGYYEAGSTSTCDVAAVDLVLEQITDISLQSQGAIMQKFDSGVGWYTRRDGSAAEVILYWDAGSTVKTPVTGADHWWLHHQMCFVDYDGSAQWYIDGVASGSPLAMSSPGSASNAGLFRIGQGISNGDTYIARLAVWTRASGWLDTHLQASVAMTRCMQWSGVYPDTVTGSAIAVPTSSDRCQRWIATASTNWPICRRDVGRIGDIVAVRDSGGTVYRGIQQHGTAAPNLTAQAESSTVTENNGTLSNEVIDSPDGRKGSNRVQGWDPSFSVAVHSYGNSDNFPGTSTGWHWVTQLVKKQNHEGIFCGFLDTGVSGVNPVYAKGYNFDTDAWVDVGSTQGASSPTAWYSNDLGNGWILLSVGHSLAAPSGQWRAVWGDFDPAAPSDLAFADATSGASHYSVGKTVTAGQAPTGVYGDSGVRSFYYPAASNVDTSKGALAFSVLSPNGFSIPFDIPLVSVNDGSAATDEILVKAVSGGTLAASMRTTAGTDGDITHSTTIDDNAVHSICLKWANNNLRMSVISGTWSTIDDFANDFSTADSTCSVPQNLDRIFVGTNVDGTGSCAPLIIWNFQIFDSDI